MRSNALIDPRVVVVSLGVTPVGRQWEPPWDCIPAQHRPAALVQHVTRASGVWLREIEGAPELRKSLQHCDVMLSRDPQTDAVLPYLSQLVDQQRVVRCNGTVLDGQLSVWAALASWEDLLRLTQELLSPPIDRAALGRLVETWGATCAEVGRARVPAELAPVGRTLELLLDVQYWATGPGGDDVVRRIGFPMLAHGPDWVSGSLAAIDRIIRLRRQWHELSESDLQEVTLLALQAAESARRRGDEALARCHALIALSVVTHRSRHPQRATSSLVSDTSALVGPLRANPTLRALSDASAPAPGMRFVGRGGGGSTPHVTILPGPFGAFHTDLMAAVEPVCTVSVSDLRQQWPELRRRRPIPQDLWLLTALRQGRVDLEDRTVDGRDIQQPSLRRQVRCLWRLKIELSHHDVVVSDWGDVATMWASHLRPKRTRLVTRWHGLDLFDPWLHLIDWRGVDEVLITTAALGSVFTDLTLGTAAPEPVVISPYLPDLARFDQPKHPQAQFTIGMVGWGRMVKDPAFGLDLLDRDQRRRLVLIGPPFEETVDTMTEDYVRELTSRMASRELRERIHIVGPTDDVAGHLTGIGIILSSSLREGWHLGLIEGVASGAVPVVRDWPMLSRRGGAASVYPREWIVADVDGADRRIAAVQDRAQWQAAADEAKAKIMDVMDATAAQRDYQEYVLGERRSASR